MGTDNVAYGSSSFPDVQRVAVGAGMKTDFALLLPPTARIAAYVIREHERGRSLTEILDDPYIKNRTTPSERERLLDRPEVIRALGRDTVEAAKQEVG